MKTFDVKYENYEIIELGYHFFLVHKEDTDTLRWEYTMCKDFSRYRVEVSLTPEIEKRSKNFIESGEFETKRAEFNRTELARKMK